ncbi:hypothetical protein, partial [Pandoraea pneumonica]
MNRLNLGMALGALITGYALHAGAQTQAPSVATSAATQDLQEAVSLDVKSQLQRQDLALRKE